MAEIVVGIACSHSPQISSPLDVWSDYADQDQVRGDMIGTDGEWHTYAELTALARPDVADFLRPEVVQEGYDRMQEGMRVCAKALQDSGATVAVVFGNDHKEMFGDDGMPAFAFYLGEEVKDVPPTPEELGEMSDSLREAMWSYHAPEGETYQVDVALGTHIAGWVTDAGFDPTQLSVQPGGRTLGHAFTYTRRRLMGDTPIPMVPVHLNTLYPPNVPSAARCYALGEKVGEAVRAWDSDEKVAIVTTGGLSHFVVDEDLDRRAIDALVRHDRDAIAALPRPKLRSGNAEILNWVSAAGALRGFTMDVLDYVPAYRSLAGTGVGMTFATWT